MDSLIMQKRSRQGEDRKKPTGFSGQDNEGLDWVKRQLEWRKTEEPYDPRGSELAAAVAAAAFSIDSLEESKTETKRKTRPQVQSSRAPIIKTNKDNDNTIKGQTGARRVTDKEVQNEVSGQGFTRKTILVGKETASSSSARSTPNNAVQNGASAWERTQLIKIHKRYEKKKVAIIVSEKEQKLAAKLKMEKNKNEMEKRTQRINQLYRMKVARIENRAGGAKMQLDEKLREDEINVKVKSKRIGKVRTRCFFFPCA